MMIEAEIGYVTALLLMFVRVSALLLLSPLFAVTQLPVKIRVLFLLALTAMLLAGLQISDPIAPNNLAELFQAAIFELFIGAIMAFGLFAAFGAFLFGGRILDLQMGFGIANLIDPVTQNQGPLIGTLLNLAAVMAFFTMDGHHMLLRGLAYSLAQIPVGQGFGSLSIDAVVGQFGRMFIFGIMLVASAVFALLLLDVGLAITARTMPQLNIFIVGMPLKIFAGTVVLIFSLNYLGPLLKKIFESIFRYWEQVLI